MSAVFKKEFSQLFHSMIGYVCLAVFAAIGVVIGKYRDGDRKTRQQMKQVLERFN